MEFLLLFLPLSPLYFAVRIESIEDWVAAVYGWLAFVLVENKASAGRKDKFYAFQLEWGAAKENFRKV